jgi:Autotransporter beta-domain
MDSGKASREAAPRKESWIASSLWPFAKPIAVVRRMMGIVSLHPSHGLRTFQKYTQKVPFFDNLAAGGWTWTPAARLRYVAGWFDGYSETGSAQNLTVNARTVQDLEGKLELALATTQPFGAAQLGLQLKGGVIGLTRLGDRTIDVNLIGQGLSFTTPGRDSAVGVFSGVQFDCKIKQNVNAFVSLEGQALSDSSFVASARGGVEIRF